MRNRILILIQGGCVQDVAMSTAIDYVVIDLDNPGPHYVDLEFKDLLSQVNVDHLDIAEEDIVFTD